MAILLESAIKALGTAQESAYKFRATKARRQTRKEFTVDPVKVGVAIRTLILGKNDTDKNTWMQDPKNSWKLFAEVDSVNVKMATRLFSNLPPMTFSWLLDALDGLWASYYADDAPKPVKITLGSSSRSKEQETPARPETSPASFEQALAYVERKLATWADAGMPISAEVLAEKLARHTAKMLRGGGSSDGAKKSEQQFTQDMLLLNAAIQNAAYTAISKHNLRSDPLRHLMQTQASNSIVDDAKANNAFVQLTLPFIKERLTAGTSAKGLNLWIIAPTAVSAQTKQSWAKMDVAQRTHFVHSHTIQESGLGAEHNQLRTTAGDVYELDHAGRMLYALAPAARVGSNAAIKHAISVGTPARVQMDSHTLVLLPIGAELVVPPPAPASQKLTSGCDVCGGDKKKAAAMPAETTTPEEEESKSPDSSDMEQGSSTSDEPVVEETTETEPAAAAPLRNHPALKPLSKLALTTLAFQRKYLFSYATTKRWPNVAWMRHF